MNICELFDIPLLIGHCKKLYYLFFGDIYNIHTDYIYYLVGGFEHFLFSPIAGMIQSDFPIFQRD